MNEMFVRLMEDSNSVQICLGGKVPKEMYVDNVDKDKQSNFTTVTIKKGGKLELDMLTSEIGSLLRYTNRAIIRMQLLIALNTCSWEFRSEDHDIKFGILKKDTNGTKKEIIPVRRVAAHQLDEVGILNCEAPATCKKTSLLFVYFVPRIHDAFINDFICSRFCRVR